MALASLIALSHGRTRPAAHFYPTLFVALRIALVLSLRLHKDMQGRRSGRLSYAIRIAIPSPDAFMFVFGCSDVCVFSHPCRLGHHSH